jgi:adenylate kinase family enzyme
MSRGSSDSRLTRLALLGHRSDDRDQEVTNRLPGYRAQAAPLVGSCRDRCPLVPIDGAGSIEEVAEHLEYARTLFTSGG